MLPDQFAVKQKHAGVAHQTVSSGTFKHQL
jgi:hypothetical protein